MTKKSMWLWLGVLFVLPLTGIAQDDVQMVPIDPTFAPPEWLQAIILTVQSFPVVGPIVIEVCKWAGLVAAVMTVFSVFVQGIVSGLGFAFNYLKKPEMAQKVLELGTKVVRVLKYASMFNVQKK